MRPVGGHPCDLPLVVLGAWACCLIMVASENAQVTFENRAAVDVDVFWRDNAHAQWVKLTQVPQGGSGGLNTFEGHTFIVAEAGAEPDFFRDEPNYIQEHTKQSVKVTGDRGGRLLVTSTSAGFGEVVSSFEMSPNGSSTTRSHSTSEAAPDPQVKSVTAMFRNLGPGGVSVFWSDQAGQQYRALAELAGGKETKINTFRGHELLVVAEGVHPNYQVHRANYRPQAALEWVRVSVQPGSGEVHVDVSPYEKKSESKSEASFEGVRDSPYEKKSEYKWEASFEGVLDSLKVCGRDPACITDSVFRTSLAKIQSESLGLLDAREEVEEAYRDYACTSHESLLPAEEWPTKVWEWTGPDRGASGDNVTFKVKVDQLFERRDARVYVLHDFIRPEECQALKDRATPMLTHAAVTGDSPGEKIVSKARKAQAALVMPRYDDPQDILVPLRQRVFDFATEHSNGDTYTLPGQEPFSVIKYNVSGDEYRLHCDGYCDGSPYRPAGRAATMVVFCEEAERGGQTSFTNADLLIKGKPGQAVYFNYKDARGLMDQGWTRHGGCPVLEGTKWIATQWIRLGVSNDDPWNHYTPTGDRDFMR